MLDLVMLVHPLHGCSFDHVRCCLNCYYLQYVVLGVVEVVVLRLECPVLCPYPDSLWVRRRQLLD